MRRTMLWLRWSWRDLRARWLQVAAIALIIGIGSGVYSGLTSTADWRRASYTESYERLGMHDLRFEFGNGVYVDADQLAAVAGSVDGVSATDTRLVVPTQVDASTADETVLVSGRIIGMAIDGPGAKVNDVVAKAGRELASSDDGRDIVVLDRHFARHYDLPPSGSLMVSGGRTVDYVGQGLAPEYFIVFGESGSLLGEADFAVMWTSLATAQRLSGHTGQANDLVVRLAPGAPRAATERSLSRAIEDAFPDAGFTVTSKEQDRGYELLYNDIEGDQRLYNIFAILILAGAAFAAFNLTGRIVEAQRREIGIGMAMGVPRARIALRPLLVGAQVALLGVVAGVGVGFMIDALMAGLLNELFPLPVWDTAFQVDVFVKGAVLGFVLPLVAVSLPVARAMRVTPIEAITTTHRSASTSRLATLVRHIPLPGSSVAQMPLRNVLRTPRRTLLTALGIAAAITTLVGVIGMVDSFIATVDRGEAEIVGDSPDRISVNLAGFFPVDSAQTRAVTDAPVVGVSEPGLSLGATLEPEGEAIDVLLRLTDFNSEVWRPTAKAGSLDDPGQGIALAEKAAADLDVAVGDRIPVRFPRREGTGATYVTRPLRVIAIQPNPYRFVAYMDSGAAGLMNLEGIVNTVQVTPADGVTVDEVRRALFEQPSVASSQSVGTFADTIRDSINEYLGILRVVEGAVLLLALLIAFNSTSINVDERAREHATMFAFGLRVRSVLGVSITESLLTGVLGTVIGVLAGRLLLEWMVAELLSNTLPDLGIVVAVATSTLVTAFVLGVVAVALAPVLTVRRLRRMDISSTLRVVE